MECQRLYKPCYTLVSLDKCAIHPKTIYTTVHCEGDLSVSGQFDHVFNGKVYAKNGNDLSTLPRASFNKGTFDISQSTLDTSKYLDLIAKFDDVESYFQSHLKPQGWKKFGTTQRSFHKDCDAGRCIIHVVEKTGDISASYTTVLEMTGLSHQKNYHGRVLRFCTTDWGKPNCKQNKPMETYQDDDEGSRTLVVFLTDGKVTLKSTSDGRKWGPTVFAPRATVVPSSDFTDGGVIVGRLYGIGWQRKGDQLHGDCFKETVMCV